MIKNKKYYIFLFFLIILNFYAMDKIKESEENNILKEKYNEISKNLSNHIENLLLVNLNEFSNIEEKIEKCFSMYKEFNKFIDQFREFGLTLDEIKFFDNIDLYYESSQEIYKIIIKGYNYLLRNTLRYTY
jgi:hypothetical protein